MPPILPALAPRKGVTNIGALQGNFTPQAFTSGYHWAFAALAAFAAIGAVVAFVFFRGAHVPAQELEEAPALT